MSSVSGAAEIVCKAPAAYRAGSAAAGISTSRTQATQASGAGVCGGLSGSPPAPGQRAGATHLLPEAGIHDSIADGQEAVQDAILFPYKGFHLIRKKPPPWIYEKCQFSTKAAWNSSSPTSPQHPAQGWPGASDTAGSQTGCLGDPRCWGR